MEDFPLPEGEAHRQLEELDRAARQRVRRMSESGRPGRTPAEAMLIGSVAHWTMARPGRRFLLPIVTAVVLGLFIGLVVSPGAGAGVGVVWGAVAVLVELRSQRNFRLAVRRNREVVERPQRGPT